VSSPLCGTRQGGREVSDGNRDVSSADAGSAEGANSARYSNQSDIRGEQSGAGGAAGKGRRSKKGLVVGDGASTNSSGLLVTSKVQKKSK